MCNTESTTNSASSAFPFKAKGYALFTYNVMAEDVSLHVFANSAIPHILKMDPLIAANYFLLVSVPIPQYIQYVICQYNDKEFCFFFKTIATDYSIITHVCFNNWDDRISSHKLLSRQIEFGSWDINVQMILWLIFFNVAARAQNNHSKTNDHLQV